jgi:hypothetical protein
MHRSNVHPSPAVQGYRHEIAPLRPNTTGLRHVAPVVRVAGIDKQAE